MRTLIITVLVASLSFNAQAQFFKKLKKRVEEKVEQTVTDKVEKKAEEQTEKTLDSILNKKKKSKKNKNENASMEMMKDILSGGGEVNYERAYTFLITATMQVTDFTSKKDEMATMMQSYGKDAIMSKVEQSPAPIIVDFKNNAALIVMDNEIQLMSMNWMQKMMGGSMDADEEDLTATVVKTGNTKILNGYTCYEYNITHQQTKINAWFAPDVDFTYQDYLRGFSKMFAGKKKANPIQLLNEGYGYVMEMKAYLNGDLQNEMKVTQLDKTPITINTENYTIQKMF